MLRRLYDWTLNLARHRHALWALFGVAIIESSFFIVPPDLLLIPMVLAARNRTWLIAGVCTVGSVLGGVLGYGIGMFALEAVGLPILEMYHAVAKFETIRDLYNEHGALIVFSAGFSPIPYKVFTIASGVADMDILMFTMASIVGRGSRFFLVAFLLWKFGNPIKSFIEKYLAQLTMAFVILMIMGFIALKTVF